MILLVKLHDSSEAALKAKAQAQGLSVEEFAALILDRELEAQQLPATDVPFWKTFTNEVHALPDDVFDRLPADGASEHDHYLYGLPKKNP